MKLFVLIANIFILVMFSYNTYGQQSLENLDVLNEKIEKIEGSFIGAAAVTEGEVLNKYSLSPLFIDADGTRLAGASFGIRRDKNKLSSRYLNIEGGINQYLLRYSRDFHFLELPSALKVEFKDTDLRSEQLSISSEITKVFPKAGLSATFNLGWRERKFKSTNDEASDIFSSFSVAKLIVVGSSKLGVSATYSPKNDLDDSSFVLSAQLVGSGFYLELDDDDTIVVAYNFSWGG